MKNCGMNSSGMELGYLTQQKSQDKNEMMSKINLNRCGNNEGQNQNSDTKEEEQGNKNTQRTNEAKNQPKPLSLGKNVPASGRSNCCGSISQDSSFSFASTRWDWLFLTNMNNNMQGMVCPLMMMMQKNQEREEEKDQEQHL
ncbi:hypothetical protein O181_086644 [Austropuccinia psidii MF-1]|uniref:Uncharacterized protein n=1 Tax=Austropuccinia psidii MF-1 TaxID=1389203 RepID=A0A9Q3FXD0_9BASI|nr:hypothetical protein [Austropuccinia psidii MF-1]